MKKSLPLLLFIFSLPGFVQAQTEPGAGTWKTWFISSGRDYRLPAPPKSDREETAEIISRQQNLDVAGLQQIIFWNAGSPGYRWQEIMSKLWMTDTTYNGPLANMLLGVAIYDATVAAWDSKYAFNRRRPYITDRRVRAYVPKPESPSYPCEHSVAAGVAATVISHFFPSMADSVKRLAQQSMNSRIAAGVAYASDTHAGFELGKKIAEAEIARTKDFAPKMAWDKKMPDKPGVWKGKNPVFPLAGRSKTVVLDSSSQFRPGPPPDFTKDMEELRKFKPTYRSMSNAFYYASLTPGDELLTKEIFERNLHLNPPRAARIYAATAIAMYDGFVACWDAKYAYWGIRPDQLDTNFHPALIHTPPFPGYPSGHATIGAVMADLHSYFFPEDKAMFQKRAKDGAESRFQGGIHFRTDNEVGLELGRKVAAAIVRKIKADGADEKPGLASKGKEGQ